MPEPSSVCSLAGPVNGQLSYLWSISSFTGLNNLSSITSSPNSQQLYIPPGMLSPGSEYTFSCQVCSLAHIPGTALKCFETGIAAVPASDVLVSHCSPGQ